VIAGRFVPPEAPEPDVPVRDPAAPPPPVLPVLAGAALGAGVDFAGGVVFVEAKTGELHRLAATKPPRVKS